MLLMNRELPQTSTGNFGVVRVWQRFRHLTAILPIGGEPAVSRFDILRYCSPDVLALNRVTLTIIEIPLGKSNELWLTSMAREYIRRGGHFAQPVTKASD
jgi:hypothetical protein